MQSYMDWSRKAARAITGLSAKPDDFADSALTFVATGCAGADAAFHALAKHVRTVTNVVDRPELCDATTPSIVDRDPVVVAIGTEGHGAGPWKKHKDPDRGLAAPTYWRIGRTGRSVARCCCRSFAAKHAACLLGLGLQGRAR